MSERVCIDARDLLRIEPTHDGQGVCLHLLDQAGRAVVLRLPASVARAAGEAASRAPAPATLHPVDNWRLRPSDDGTALVLTLHTTDGCAASYVMKRWQVEGIATLAFHGDPAARPSRLVN